MSMHRVTTTAITGLTSASWNTVDLDSWVSVPSGATAAIITVENTTGTNRNIGIRTTGKTTPIADIATAVQGAKSMSTFVVPLGTGNQIDLNPEINTSLEFTVSGFLSSAWTILDIDSPTTIAGNTNTLTTTPVSAAPANATLLLLNLNGWWRPTGQSTTLGATGGNNIPGSTSAPNTSFVYLNGSKEFDVACTTAITVLAYCTTGVNWSSWLASPELTDGTVTKSAASPTAASWYDGPTTYTGKSYVYFAPQYYSSGRGFGTRANGDTKPTFASANTTAGSFGRLTPLTSGVYEYTAENATTLSDTYALLTFDTAATMSVTDAGDEQFNDGESGITVTGTGFGSTQGSGKVYICPTNDVNDVNRVEQTVNAWGDTSINITAVRGSLASSTNLYLFVLTDGAVSNPSGLVVQFNSTKKLKVLVHSSAASATGIKGVVFAAPAGAAITGTEIGEFTGQTFEAGLESGQAVLKVSVSEFGGTSLTTSDTPVVLVRNDSNTTGIIQASIIEE